jgi:hypothetical protein
MYKNNSHRNNLDSRHHLCAARRCRHQFANPAANPIVNPAKTNPRKHLISRKFPVFPKNAAQTFNAPPHSTFPSQVLEMPNSAPLATPVRKAHKFLSILAYSQPSTPLSINTLSLQKNTLNMCDRSLTGLIDPDRPQTIDHQDQSTSDRFLKSAPFNPKILSKLRSISRNLSMRIFVPWVRVQYMGNAPGSEHR